MWFNNLLIYNYTLEDHQDLESSLRDNILKPCPPHARFTYGWLPVFQDLLVHEVAGCAMVCLGKEERVLPRGVIVQEMEKKIAHIQTERGYKVSKSEKSQLAEDLEFELLPKSFCVQKQQYAFLDTIKKRLLVNSASANQAGQLLTSMRKTLPGLSIEPLAISTNLALRFVQWMNDPIALPAVFQLASDCLLFSLNDEKKRFNCKGYDLPADEVAMLLDQGLVAAEISLIWNERIQFTLTQDLVLKKIKSLNYLTDEFHNIDKSDNEYEIKDASLILLSGELRSLVDDLLKSVADDYEGLQQKKMLDPVSEEEHKILESTIL